MFGAITYWSWLATFILIVMTYQDYKHNRNIDDRKNFLALGLSISLISHFDRSFIYLIGLLALSIGLDYLNNKYKLIGAADTSALKWIMLGFGIIGLNVLMFYYVIFTILTAIYYGTKYIIKNKKNIPFFPVLLSSFFINCIIWGLYI